MKINEIITEEFDPYDIHDLRDPLHPEKTPPVKDAEHIAEIIKTNCSQMLAAYQKTQIVLLRGIAGWPNIDPIIMGIRPDRKPFDVPLYAHKKLHLAFLEAGLPATRMNSIFCSTQESIAGGWGRLYIIFVKDGWTGTVFEDFKTEYAYPEMRDIGTNKNLSIKQMAQKIKSHHPIIVTPNNLPQILSQRYEDILITGDSFIGFKIFLGRLTPQAKKVFKILGLKPTNVRIR